MGGGRNRSQPALRACARVRLGHGDQAVDCAAAPVLPDCLLCVLRGLFANAVLPGRVGELARVVTLRRRLSVRKGTGTTATLVGSVFAHRMFDLFPALTLVIWVLFTAKIPGWALTSILLALAVGGRSS